MKEIQLEDFYPYEVDDISSKSFSGITVLAHSTYNLSIFSYFLLLAYLFNRFYPLSDKFDYTYLQVIILVGFICFALFTFLLSIGVHHQSRLNSAKLSIFADTVIKEGYNKYGFRETWKKSCVNMINTRNISQISAQSIGAMFVILILSLIFGNSIYLLILLVITLVYLNLDMTTHTMSIWGGILDIELNVLERKYGRRS